jgi:hypothetical protein
MRASWGELHLAADFTALAMTIATPRLRMRSLVIALDGECDGLHAQLAHHGPRVAQRPIFSFAWALACDTSRSVRPSPKPSANRYSPQRPKVDDFVFARDGDGYGFVCIGGNIESLRQQVGRTAGND